MNAFLTAITFVVLIAAAAYPIHRLNIQHADTSPLPGRRGRFPPRRRRTTHHG
ncbi:hypothetical protein SAMN06272735_4657 [Streptomyces sp. TLI_55]|uniref:hypothetical protein n=1 Tax=Streptomyces sp. TLI_55 TaxID=1938861 RepID=UPI000BD9D944|nr:hypothetical protein [Streptomyces sp. TLI_55]SNX62865.1 hypothetical protein SAMN06272735_4657 [Streptomyces sp. TLI_55]